MAILSNQAVTLNSGVETLLFRARFRKTRLTLTGISGELTTIPFRTKKRGFIDSGLFEASEVKLRAFETMPAGDILATTPQGVGTLDIIYEVRTAGDA